MLKKMMSLVLTFALLFSLAAPAAAGHVNPREAISVSEDGSVRIDARRVLEMSEQEIRVLVQDLGLSQSEIDLLFNGDAMNPGITTMEANFPENPDIGETHTEYLYISLENVQTSADIYLQLAMAGIPPTLATTAAAAAFALSLDYPGSAGIEFEVNYYYGPDNDGIVRWNYSTIECSLYGTPINGVGGTNQ